MQKSNQLIKDTASKVAEFDTLLAMAFYDA